MRSTLSPAFTSSKIKYMFSLMSQSGEQFVNHYINQNEKVITVEMRDIITKFANDVIANIVFGYECDSVKDPNNEFYVMGKELTNFFSVRTFVVFMGNVAAPKLFKVSILSTQICRF